MSKHDEAWKAREDARRAMIGATADLAQCRLRLGSAEVNLAASRTAFIDADRKFQQLLAADSAGVLGNVAQVEHAKPTTK